MWSFTAQAKVDAPAAAVVDITTMEQVARRVFTEMVAAAPRAVDAPLATRRIPTPLHPNRFTQWAQRLWAKARRIRVAKLCGLIFLYQFVIFGILIVVNTPGQWTRFALAQMGLATVVSLSIAFNIKAFYKEGTDEDAEGNGAVAVEVAVGRVADRTAVPDVKHRADEVAVPETAAVVKMV